MVISTRYTFKWVLANRNVMLSLWINMWMDIVLIYDINQVLYISSFPLFQKLDAPTKRITLYRKGEGKLNAAHKLRRTKHIQIFWYLFFNQSISSNYVSKTIHTGVVWWNRGSSIFHFQIISFYDRCIVKINVIGSTVLLTEVFLMQQKILQHTDYIYVFLKISNFNWLQLILANLSFILRHFIQYVAREVQS